VPQIRRLARDHRDLPLRDALALLDSAWHEERLLALLLLVDAHDRAPDAERRRILDAYLANTAHVDNYTNGGGNWVLDYGCLKFGVNRLAGAGIGPEVFGRYDLSADATFTTSSRCGAFDYGNGATGPGVPAAPPQQFPSRERKRLGTTSGRPS